MQMMVEDTRYEMRPMTTGLVDDNGVEINEENVLNIAVTLLPIMGRRIKRNLKKLSPVRIKRRGL